MPELLASEKGRPYFEAHQHAIVLFTRKPARHWVIMLAVLALAAVLWPWPMLVVFLIAAGSLGVLRFRLWQAERVVLTHRRIIHVYGVLETTREEASLRLDRISGLRLRETFLGGLLNYANIYIEAPGDHPGLKRLFRISRGQAFYPRLRNIVFNEQDALDPDDSPDEQYVTDELPQVSDHVRYRRRDWGVTRDD